MTKIILSGGGTGGHVFPAIAIANAIRKIEPGADILFIGALGRMEMEKVPAAGYPIEGLPVSGFIRRLTWKNLQFPFRLAASLYKAGQILRRFHPDLVIGVGGYASGPTLRIAARQGIPTLIQEQNSIPGVTNRILAPKVNRICVAYEGMERYFPPEKILLTGNPVRQDLMDITGKREDAFAHFRLDRNKVTLLVIGGSGGAGTLNRAIFAMIRDGLPDNLQILWQTGKYYFEEFSALLKNLPEGPVVSITSGIEQSTRKVTILPFIDRMDLAYAASGIIVSRAGAIAISELAIVGKPVILVPSPNVAEDHQTRNAQALVNKKAAVMVRDVEAIDNLAASIRELLDNERLREELQTSIRQFALPDAADVIAKETLKMINKD